MQVYYLAEIDLPNTSAYSLHVLKMCDALAENNNVKLIIFSCEEKVNYSKLKHDYLLKNKFKIVCYNKIKKKKNFILRIKFSYFCKKIIDKDSLIISRSIIASLYLSFFNYFNYLELHHNLKSLTKLLFFFKDILFKKIFFILIHKNLVKILSIKKNYIILDDASDINDFKPKKKCKYTFSYLGSLYKGKGIEIIIYLAKNFTRYDFNIFGDLASADKEIISLIKKSNLKNLYLHGHVNYSYAVNAIKSSRYLLMPYLNRVMVRSNNLDVSNFMSPLKMFDYLSSGNVLIASNMSVYQHILKDNYNCILASPNNFSDWKKKILLILNNKFDIDYIKKNALLTARKYTWRKRVDKIFNNYFNAI
jgi:glycosyltransferase involved in cell wall biosynthesis